MNRIVPSAVLFLSLLMVGCGKEASESPTGTETPGTPPQANKDSLVAERIAGHWQFEGSQNEGGVTKTVTAWVDVQKNGSSTDTIETYSAAGGKFDNPRYATSRTWVLSASKLIFTKSSCQKRDNDGVWGSIDCGSPIYDTLHVDSILAGKPIVFRGATGEVTYKKLVSP